MWGRRRDQPPATVPAAEPYPDIAYDDQRRGNPPALYDQEPYYGPADPEERMPLIYWLGWAALNATRGSARIDVIRPTKSRSQGRAGFLGLPRIRPEALFRPPTLPEDDYPHYRSNSLLGLTHSGARFQVMRHIDWGAQRRRRARPVPQNAGYDPDGYDADSSYSQPGRSWGAGSAYHAVKRKLWEKLLQPQRPWVDLGVGFDFDLDRASLLPKARIKFKDLFSIKLCPNPSLKLQKRWRLPGSATAVRLHWDVPLNELLDWDTRRPVPSRFWVRLENNIGRGVHLTPSGLDLDEHVWYLGRGTAVRAGGSVGFPREIPVPPGDPPLNWRVQRLGIKTRW